jgi:hypothetical protein
VYTMAPRVQLQSILESIVANVYFQPPSNVQMEYPAIVYERAPADSTFADNEPYSVTKQYQLTMITRDPDEAAFDTIAALSMCTHERFYVADNLNHDVFTIFF